ncbi:MAG: hypothetical protein H6732_02115 [Alphaproteobacteria bacterium]|nr:hypothetical protein [Alphaproteobacteria bacterium]
MTRFHALLPVLALTAACAAGGTTVIEDEGMTNTGKTLGTQAGDLAGLEEDAEESAVQSKVNAMGGTMQTLAGQHISYGASSGTGIPGLSRAELAQGSTEYAWDGTNLVLVYAAEGTGLTYEVRLAYTSNDVGGTTIDGTYVVGIATGASGVGVGYALDVTFDQVAADDAGCVVSGAIDISYEVGVSGLEGIPGADLANQSGRVVATYLGCDDVQISGS